LRKVRRLSLRSESANTGGRFPLWVTVGWLCLEHKGVSAALIRLSHLALDPAAPFLNVEPRYEVSSWCYLARFCVVLPSHRQQRLARQREPSTRRGECFNGRLHQRSRPAPEEWSPGADATRPAPLAYGVALDGCTTRSDRDTSLGGGACPPQ